MTRADRPSLASLLAGWLAGSLSVRATALPDPTLALDRCALPRALALALLAAPLRLAGGSLEALLHLRPVLLSRPGGTDLHGVRAFFVELTGDAGATVGLAPGALLAMGVEPGDAVGVHALLDERSCDEARQRMMAPGNTLAPEDGLPRLPLSADAVLGLAYLSQLEEGARGQAPLPDDLRLLFSDFPGTQAVAERSLAEQATWKNLAQATSERTPWVPDPDDIDRAMERSLRRLKAWQLSWYGHLRGFFSSVDEARAAHDAGELSPRARIFLKRGARHDPTTLGRALIAQATGCDPAEVNQPCGRKVLQEALRSVCARRGVEAAVSAHHRMESLGIEHATRSGISLGIDSFPAPEQKASIIRRALDSVTSTIGDYHEGLITDGERNFKIIDTWSDANERARDAARRQAAPTPGCPLTTANMAYFMAHHGAAGDHQSFGQTAAMRGQMASNSGEIHENPAVESWREGLGPIGYFQNTFGARRKALVDRKTAVEARSMLDILRQALGSLRVVEEDCGSLGGLPVSAIASDTEFPAVPLRSRVAGRTPAASLCQEEDDEPAPLQGERLERLLATRHRAVPIRTLITCEAEGGVCAACHGAGPGLAGLPAIDDPVGLRAAQAIAAIVPRVTNRTISLVYGYRSGYRQLHAQSRDGGVLFCHEAGALTEAEIAHAFATSSHGQTIVMVSGVDLVELDDNGDEQQRRPLPVGAAVQVAQGDPVKEGQQLAVWTTETLPVLAARSGVVRFTDLVPGQTCDEKLNEYTGLMQLVVTSNRGGLKPGIFIERQGNIVHAQELEIGTLIEASMSGHQVTRGDTIAIAPRGDHGGLFGDILAGRTELFDLLIARHPTDPAVLFEIDGIVSIEDDVEGLHEGVLTRGRLITVTPQHPAPAPQHARRRWLPPGKLLLCREGDRVRAGDPIHPAPPDPHDLVRLFPLPEVALLLLDRLLRIAALWGAPLAQQHAELALREMLSFVRVTDPGDSPLPPGKLLRRPDFFRLNASLQARNLRHASADPALVGLPRVTTASQ